MSTIFRKCYEIVINVHLLLLLLQLLLISNNRVSGAKTLNMAVMVPWSGGYGFYFNMPVTLGVPIALDDIVSFGLLPGYKFNWTWKNTQCQALVGSRALETVYNSYFNRHIDVIIGDGCSGASETFGLMASAWNVPMVSYSATSSRLSNKTMLPTFTRLVFPTVDFAQPIDRIMNHFKWTRVAIISDTNALHTSASNVFFAYLKQQGKTAYVYVVDTVYDTGKVLAYKIPPLLRVLESVKTKARLIIYLAYDVEFLVYACFKLGMVNGDYVFFVPDGIADTWPNFDDGAEAGGYGYLKNMGPAFNPTKLYTGVIYVTPSQPIPGPKWTNFTARAMAKYNDSHFAASYIKMQGVNLTNGVNYAITVYTAITYYCVMLWAIGVNKTLTANGSAALSNGLAVARNMMNTTLPFGPLDGVRVNEIGNGYVDFDIVIAYNIRPQSSDYVVLFRYLAANGSVVAIYPNNPNITVPWPGGRTSPPEDEPPCGWSGCALDFWSEQAIVGLAFGGVCILFVLALVVLFAINSYMRLQAKVEALKKAFIRWVDIDKALYGKRRDSVSTVGSTISGVSSLSGSQYGNSMLEVRRLDNQSWPLIKMSVLMKEIEQMLSVHHDNLCRFVGVCIEKDNRCVAMARCSMGCLQDVLQDGTVTGDFLFYFATDIAEGLNYLHKSELGSHGFLTSGCCFVDTYWAVKISDFGMAHFRHRRQIFELAFESPFELLWTAPELLRTNPKRWPLYGTQPGDVYSYGILLHEIAFKDMPYGNLLTDLGPREIIRRVTKRSNDPFRPYLIPTASVGDTWFPIMAACWAEVPEERLTIMEARAALRALHADKNFSVADKAIKLLEKHTLNLEGLVEERTAELVKEKRKWENLLDQLFPLSVTRHLLAGEPVLPVSYEHVTVGFTDIVGFQNIVFQLSPLKIVTFLNQVYTLFDTVIREHDVYKVETIGDNYVMCSGLPIPNGDRHAGEMATVSLYLLNVSLLLRTPVDNANQQLQLRVGLHTGAAVAGVTGIVRPRYSLYGDTINIASRMLTSSLALRIHVSSDAAALLLKDGDYAVESRGERDVKGRGKMTTYWLLNKISQPVTLPDLSLALSADQHYFK